MSRHSVKCTTSIQSFSPHVNHYYGPYFKDKETEIQKLFCQDYVYRKQYS